MLAGDLQWQDAVDRAEGFLEASREHGVAARIIDGGAWDPPLRTPRRAAVCSQRGSPERCSRGNNDQVALGLLSALRDTRVRVPEERRRDGGSTARQARVVVAALVRAVRTSTHSVRRPSAWSLRCWTGAVHRPEADPRGEVTRHHSWRRLAGARPPL